MVTRLLHLRRESTVWIADQHDARAVETHVGDASNQAFGGQHRHIGAYFVPQADIDHYRSPPVGRVLSHNTGGFQRPRDALLPAQGPTQLRVFPRGFLCLRELFVQSLVFLAEFVDLLEERAARREGITGLFGEILRRASQGEERQEKSAQRELEFAGRLLGQVENNEHEQQNQADRHIILPS